ncbi:ABC transporter ATP-binding protein [Mesobacterium pallidum]|uniref:ABC transporter ATP-binding protein n=1 Tax=Mesobacterium pallidum TaxID=2872037 RepID=UPI001EE2F571|nr:oligopeptide/dipeptide ABC transporter ATP-binding protein [Mesobacterium pallidum]
MTTQTQDSLIEVRDLEVHFNVGSGTLGSGNARRLRAVDGVTFDILRGETLGLVGESGCGKSTVGRALLRLTDPTAGRVLFDGQDMGRLGRTALRKMRRHMQMVYQDPYASLNPRMTIGDIVGEPLTVHGIAKGAERERRVADLLELVGLDASAMTRYPHEFSGGQRQRVGIARALAVEPDFFVLDESISALDVSIQAQIINLLKRLQRERELTYLFISHDMAVVRHMSDRVAVMYLGAIVELADSRRIYEAPRHPYTKALLKAVPVPRVEGGKKATIEGIKGELSSPLEKATGCRFRSRCPLAEARCHTEVPLLRAVEKGHLTACHLA